MVNFEHFRLPSGPALRYALAGTSDANAPVLLLLHGFTDSWFSFSPILPLLPESVRVVLPDQRGHGESERPPLGYTLEDYASDALALLDHVGAARATVIGHSMGSFIAQSLAAGAGDRVEKLVLVGSGPTMKTDLVRELSNAVEAFEGEVPRDFIREFQLSTVHRLIPDVFLERVIEESAKVPLHVWRESLRGFLQCATEELISALRCPTLVLGGDCDTTFPPVGQAELARRIPGATLALLPGVGHAPHWEAPEEFVRSCAAAGILEQNAIPARRRAAG